MNRIPPLLTSLCAMIIMLSPAEAAEVSLVERLGYPAGAKLLIINADDYGMNFATCQATEEALEKGIVTSATVMTPCPWFLQAVDYARSHPKANLGVHLTLTSEWRRYKWGPVLGAGSVPSLCDKTGYFYPDIEAVYAHATLEEIDREVRAQIDRALNAGIDVTHLDSHMGTLQMNAHYHEIYVQAAKDYALPCRMVDLLYMKALGFPHLIAKADALGVLHPERLIWGDAKNLAETEAFWTKKLKGVKRGCVSELYIHCGRLTPEMAATTFSSARRTADTEFFSKPETLALIKDLGIELISYRELRYLQRNGVPMPR